MMWISSSNVGINKFIKDLLYVDVSYVLVSIEQDRVNCFHVKVWTSTHGVVWYQIILKSVLSPSLLMKYFNSRMSHSTNFGGNHSEISHSAWWKLPHCPVFGNNDLHRLSTQRAYELFTFQIMHTYRTTQSYFVRTEFQNGAGQNEVYHISHTLYVDLCFIRARSCP